MSDQELINLIREIRSQFEELHSLQRDRDNEIIQEIRELQDSLAGIIHSRSDEQARAAKRAAFLSERNAQILIGSIALLILTALLISFADRATLQEFSHKLIPIVGVLWISFIAFMLGVKPPSVRAISPEESPQNDESNI